MRFNIFDKLQAEIDDFDQGGYYITGKPKAGSLISKDFSKQAEKGGYYYSQKQTLESIDLAGASKYKKGIRDEEGQRKTFINVVNFYRDVMKMKININVANYIMEPTSLDFVWPVYLMDRKFKTWSQEESYDDQIDEYGHDLSTYGTTVAKRLKDCTERVPLRTLRNTQTAKSLLHACMNGGYAIIENEFHYNEMKKYPGWKIDGLSKDKSYCTYERYALVPRGLLKEWDKKGDGIYEGADDEMVLVQAILVPHAKDGEKVKQGKIVWMEELDEYTFPLEECHAEKVDGRWLGKGEIEKQLENQIARNLTANLRRRGLLWAVRKIFQSADEEVPKELLAEVKDGQVIHIKPNGGISQVNTASQHLGDFASDENIWKENSQQISFAFNIATGENMPSNTPFSLGVILDKAVSSHFTMVRNTFSNFLKRCFFDQLIPLFKEEYYDEHEMQIPLGATDIENLKESIITWHMNERIWDAVLNGERIDEISIREQILNEMAKNPYLFIAIPEGFYENAHAYMKLNIDDDNQADIASLTTLYTALQAKADPRADVILKLIFAKQGKTLDALAGTAPKPAAPIDPAQAGATPVQPAAATV